MPEYLVRLVQVHESFRKAELEALAELTGVEMEIILYSENVRLDFWCARVFNSLELYSPVEHL